MSKKTKRWKFVITHDCDQQTTFDAAKQEIDSLKLQSSMQIEVGPLDIGQPNVIRISVLGQHVIVGVLFEDCTTLCSITAPSSMAWAEAVVRAKIEAMVTELLKKAGSSFVEIRQYE